MHDYLPVALLLLGRLEVVVMASLTRRAKQYEGDSLASCYVAGRAGLKRSIAARDAIGSNATSEHRLPDRKQEERSWDG